MTLSFLGRHLAAQAWEVVTLAGFAALLAGLWILHPSAALTVGGILTMLFGLWGARLWAFSRRSSREA